MGGRGSSGTKAASAASRYNYSVHDNGDGSGTILASDHGQLIGTLQWDAKGVIEHVGVNKDKQRQGIATEMYNRAQKATGGKITHSPDRTDAGEGFARSVGGKIPKRSK